MEIPKNDHFTIFCQIPEKNLPKGSKNVFNFLNLTLGVRLPRAIVASLWLRLALSRIFGNQGRWLSCASHGILASVFHGKVLVLVCILSYLPHISCARCNFL